ncbi:hypothetical protein N665_0437s0014 [Sinapis alba]|nr:hypothetical protein N665_0437s0014 [Sinapis alba]
MMQQLMINQQKTAFEINTKVDNINVKKPVKSGETIEVRAEAETGKVVVDTPPVVCVYARKVSYPVRQKNSRKDLEATKCKEMMSELIVKLSFEYDVEMMHALKKYVKSFVTNKTTSPKEIVLTISKRHSTLLANKVPEKMEDPQSFVLSFEIEGAIFRRSLCDLGSSVNLLPYTMAKRLGITNFRPIKIQLIFADRLVRHPVGIVLDIDVVIKNHKIHVDLVVMELDQEPKDPFILGHLFLDTAGAIIDVKRRKINLHLEDIIMKFEVNKMLKKLRWMVIPFPSIILQRIIEIMMRK